MSEEVLPPNYEDKEVEVEGRHILIGISFSLLGILIVGTGLIYYREGLKYRRQERLLETILSVVDLVTGEEKRYDYMRLAEKEGFRLSCISDVCHGRTKTHKGYFWKHAK